MAAVKISEWRGRVGYLPPVLDLLAFAIADQRGIGEANAVAEAAITLRQARSSGVTAEGGERISEATIADIREALAEWDLLRSIVAAEGMSEAKWADFDAMARELIEAADSMMKATVHEPVGKPGGPGLWHHKGLQLPAYIQHIANDIRSKRGATTSRAIAIAIGAVKRWARGGGKVDANTQAAAKKALAEWEALKASHGGPQEAWNSKLVASADSLQHIVSEAFQQRALAERFHHRVVLIEGARSGMAENRPVAVKSAEALLGGVRLSSSEELAEASGVLEVEGRVCRVLAEALGGYGATPIRSKKGKFHGMHGMERAVKKRTHIPDSESHPVLDSINAKGSLTEAFAADLHPRVTAGQGGGQFTSKGGGGQQAQQQPQPPNGQAQGGATVQQQLDERLTQLGYQGGAASLKEFQSANGLPATGQIDDSTTAALQKADPTEQAQKQLDQSLQFGKTHAGTQAQVNRTQLAHDRLQSIGFADDVSGVSMFQKQYGMTVTGKLDPDTLAAIASVYTNNARGANKGQPDFTGIKGAGAKVTGRVGAKQAGPAKPKSIKEAIEELVEDAVVIVGGGRIITGQPFEDPDTRQTGGDDIDLHEQPSMPPGFREGDGARVCATCPHFAKGGIVVPNHFGACMLYTYPVDRMDVCDDWTTLTPQDATVAIYESRLAEAEAAGDTDEIVVTRAHLARARAEARAVTDRPLHPAHKDRVVESEVELEEFWSDAARAAARLARNAGHGAAEVGRDLKYDHQRFGPHLSDLPGGARHSSVYHEPGVSSDWQHARSHDGALKKATRGHTPAAGHKVTVSDNETGTHTEYEHDGKKWVKKPRPIAEALEEAFEEVKHPRGRGGKWTAKLGGLKSGDEFHWQGVRYRHAGANEHGADRVNATKLHGGENHVIPADTIVEPVGERSASTAKLQRAAQDRSRAVHNKEVSSKRGVQAHIDEYGMYGGAMVTRSEIYADLQKKGINPDSYMMGWKPHPDQEGASAWAKHPQNLAIKKMVFSEEDPVAANKKPELTERQKKLRARAAGSKLPGSKMSRREGHDLLTEALELPDLNDTQVEFLLEQQAILEAGGDPDEILDVYIETLLEEAELSSRSRDSLSDSDFALPGRKYPIHDEAHARNALARVAQHGTDEEKKKVRAAVKRRHPSIEMEEAVAA